MTIPAYIISRRVLPRRYEVLEVEPGEFDLEFDALGSKANLESHGIYLVNSCDHLGYEQPKCPFGKTDNNSSFNRWYTYGKRLDENTSVRSFWDPDFSNRTEFPASVARVLAVVPQKSPAKKRKAASSAAADPAGTPDDAAPAAAPAPAALSLDDDRAAAVAASDGAAAQLWYQSLEPAPFVEPKGTRERKLYTHNNQSVVVEIDATDVTSPLEPAQKLALYALIKRSVVGCPQGEEGCTLGQDVTCNSRALVFKVVMQRESEFDVRRQTGGLREVEAARRTEERRDRRSRGEQGAAEEEGGGAGEVHREAQDSVRRSAPDGPGGGGARVLFTAEEDPTPKVFRGRHGRERRREAASGAR
jgi:hypothetical protein